MSKSVNKVLLLGNVGKDPDVYSLHSGIVVNLSLATNESFKDGRGELFAQDTFHDRSILVRGVWSEITPDSHHFEESYSDDGGKTWAPAFIASLTREKQ